MKNTEKLLADNLRPVCPVCNERLELWQVKGFNFTSYFWHCECLIGHETSIEVRENLKPDIETELE